MDTIFSGDVLLDWLQTAVGWLLNHVFTPANIVYTAMQVPAVVGTGFGAWWIHDFVYPVLAERIRRSTASEFAGTTLDTLAQLLFPLMWLGGLWLAISVAWYFGWPSDVIWIAVNLLLAWVVIKLVTIPVRDPIWSRLIVIVAFTIAALNILELLEPTFRLLDSLAIDVGRVRISMLTVLRGMFFLGALLWGAVIMSSILERRIQELPSLTPTLQVLIGKLFKATLITLAIIVALASAGIDLTALAVFGGALGVGLGFGLQKVVANLISGIILLMDKSIKPGDIIQIEQTYGWVASLGARYVSVETRDGTEYLIPNEDIITQQVINWTHRDDRVRLKVQVHVAYDCDVRQALVLMDEAAGQVARVLKHPAPAARLMEFGERGLELELRFWVCDVRNGIYNVSSDVMLAIWDLFRKHGIIIPYPPPRTIHIASLPPVTAAPDGVSAFDASGSRP